MNVKELINELKECNQEARVTIVVGNEDDNIVDTGDFKIHSKEGHKIVCVRYGNPPHKFDDKERLTENVAVPEYIELFVFK